MNKRQTVWLIVRLIGVYFAYRAIVTFLSLISAIYAYTSLPAAAATNTSKSPTLNVNGVQIPTTAPRANQANSTTAGAENPGDKAKSDALKEVLWLFFLTAIYGGVGFYLIRNGKILFAVLNREELTDDAEEISSSSAPVKPKDKVVTTLDLSSGKKEEVTSLNLSEYVPKWAQVEQSEPTGLKTEETNRTENLSNGTQAEILPSDDAPNPMNESPATDEASTPATEPVLAEEETTRMDYALPVAEEKATDTPVEAPDASTGAVSDEKRSEQN